MTDERTGICIYEKGRFELRKTDNAIIDLKGDFPPIMIASNTVDDGSEPNCANMRSVLHLLNELSDNNPNEEKHWYLKKMLDKSWKQYHEQKEENEQLKKELHKIYELATVDKVRDIVENVYDDLLYETSDESDYARTKVLKCLEDIDNLRDDLE